ncbi:unnamed protein product [Rangifer tarandus platyrhynchus]|uniref:Uncharacterized protein n=2 Tax=Rangifer tarandus platyrhynchus TaxID=3082113 RepID=A0ABN8Z3D2_RANTA|nr:unnamed protein product [Rangifer tarandus platyrhynchus]
MELWMTLELPSHFFKQPLKTMVSSPACRLPAPSFLQPGHHLQLGKQGLDGPTGSTEGVGVGSAHKRALRARRGPWPEGERSPLACAFQATILPLISADTEYLQNFSKPPESVHVSETGLCDP